MTANEASNPAQVEEPPVLTRWMTVAPSMADSTGRMSHHAAFSLFSDSANAHADLLGVGYFELIKQDLFWLAVKAKVHFIERPVLGEEVTLSTWPEAPGRIRNIRHYQMRQDDQVLVCGKTEWATINWETQDLVTPRDLFPQGFPFLEGTARVATRDVVVRQEAELHGLRQGVGIFPKVFLCHQLVHHRLCKVFKVLVGFLHLLP